MEKSVPFKLLARVVAGKKPPAPRKGVGGRKRRIQDEQAATIRRALEANNWDMSCREIEEETGAPKPTVQRWCVEVRLGGVKWGSGTFRC